MEIIFRFMVLASFVYLAIMFTVVYTSGETGLQEFLSSSKSTFFSDGPSKSVGNFLWEFQICIGNFLWGFQICIGNFLWGFQICIGNFLIAFLDRFIYLILLSICIEVIIGWIYIRDEMKIMTKAVVDEGRLALAPLPEAFKAIWILISNPWKLIGYSLFIFLVKSRPETWLDLIAAAQKAQKL
jgi:hypothetical protein